MEEEYQYKIDRLLYNYASFLRNYAEIVASENVSGEISIERADFISLLAVLNNEIASYLEPLAGAANLFAKFLSTVNEVLTQSQEDMGDQGNWELMSEASVVKIVNEELPGSGETVRLRFKSFLVPTLNEIKAIRDEYIEGHEAGDMGLKYFKESIAAAKNLTDLLAFALKNE